MTTYDEQSAAVHPTDVEIHYSGEDWAALYVRGTLVRAGDNDEIAERALRLLGVTEVHDNAFMRAGACAAPTLADVREFAEKRQTDRDRAAVLKQDAHDLLKRAADLEAQYKGSE